MQLGDLLLNISSFFGTLWAWLIRLFNVSFTIGDTTITLWSIFLGVGVVLFITIFIINVFK